MACFWELGTKAAENGLHGFGSTTSAEFVLNKDHNGFAAHFWGRFGVRVPRTPPPSGLFTFWSWLVRGWAEVPRDAGSIALSVSPAELGTGWMLHLESSLLMLMSKSEN